MLFMVVEKFHDPEAAYARFAAKGRQAPEGARYVDSWVDASGTYCFQLMEAAELTPLMQWVAAWRDIIDFQIYPVVPSKEAVAIFGPEAAAARRGEGGA